MTQKEMVLRHLKDFGEITTWLAFKEYGITRLAQPIYLLRKEGYKITNRTIHSVNRYGVKVHYDSYVFGGMNEQIQE